MAGDKGTMAIPKRTLCPILTLRLCPILTLRITLVGHPLEPPPAIGPRRIRPNRMPHRSGGGGVRRRGFLF